MIRGTRKTAMAVAVLIAATFLGANPAAAGPNAPTSNDGATQVADAGHGVAVLAAGDIDIYRKIFAAQEQGDWKTADRLIDTLDNRLLMGHVLAQRYLHPTAYRSKFAELSDWMGAYADHPQARRIYRLAMKRKPAGARAPARPSGGGYLRGTGHDGDNFRVAPYRPDVNRSAAAERKARAYQRRLRHAIRNGWTLAAKRILHSEEAKKVLAPVEYDRWRATLGTGYYMDGRYEWALDWAGKAAARSGSYLPHAHWTAGLASWRLQRWNKAARHFEAAAVGEYASPWIRAAGAVWAARAHLMARHPDKVNEWLGVAAAWPRSFYGQVARRMLGLSVSFDWQPPQLKGHPLRRLLETPRAHRALALIQVGRDRDAERELRSAYGDAADDPALIRAMLGLASRTNMAGFAMRLGGVAEKKGFGRFDAAEFPVPGWKPKGGFTIDRALVFAIMRQESGFDPEAKSHAGARGLMQIMPRTASYVAKDRSLRGPERSALFDPEFNLELGQRYIAHLLDDPAVSGNLFMMATAWNGGPGNLRRWLRQAKAGDDPLLFIESIPTPETRNFVERVLTNFWIYRDRLGQPTPSLDAIAAGEWPVYTAMDGKSLMVAQHGEDRR